jgi:hypothetical protein
MQCPTCGYEGIAEEACFCPNCRYQFRVPENDVVFDSSPPDGMDYYSPRARDSGKLTKKEIRILEIQLLQPAFLLMLALTVVFYTASSRIAELSFMVSSTEIRYGGFLCFGAAAVIAWIVYRILVYLIE